MLIRPRAQWHDRSLRSWAKLANTYLPHVVAPVLVVALAYQLAKLSWLLIPGESLSEPPPMVNTAPIRQQNDAEIDVQAIMGRHMFGEISEEPEPVAAVAIVEAPETTLDLRLTATVADARDDRSGVAIIASGREERAYTVADAIDGTQGVQLHAIFSDRVILNRAGRLETLRLPRDGQAGGTVSVTRPQVAPPLPVAPSPSAPPPLPAVPLTGAARFANALRIDAHVERGIMVGFRLNPGTDGAQFRALGFQPGDVVTEINGTALNDPGLGFRVFEGLGESTVADVTVIRGGTSQVLTIDTDAVEASMRFR